MEPVLIFFLLSNCGLVVKGFFLRSCYLELTGDLSNKAVCSERHLTEVPTDIPPTVKSIDLRKNNISKIQASDFRHFPNVTSLDLTWNSISDIGKHTFSQLVSLKSLVLSRNKLIILQDDVFSGLPILTQLRIDLNQIQTVSQNAFRSLSRLLVLDLSNNKLRTIAQVHLAIRHMPKLSDLVIRKNSIGTFRSQDLTNTSTNIQFLDLSENPLVKFEVTADVFPKLNNLSIGNPTVKSNLRWAVQNSSLLRQVTTLDVSAVQLASIDEWRRLFLHCTSLNNLTINSFKNNTMLINMSCSIPTLKRLRMQNSSLFFIRPFVFQMCLNVDTLELRGNNIEHIENGSFGLLHHLKVLRLNYNNLTSVPLEIRNLQSVEVLDLNFNYISVLRRCSFDGLSRLEVLKLQGNLIWELGNAFQNNLPSLKNLSLNNNKLRVITKDAFSGLSSLTYLSLAQNQIHTLEEGCFSGLTSLHNLLLHMNELKKEALVTKCFKDLVNLRQLDLDNNHIKYSDSFPLEEPPFMNLSNLEILYISFQRAAGKSHFPSNFLQGLSSLLTFMCHSVQLKNFPNNFFTQTPRLNNLDVAANNLLDLSSKVFTPIPNLTRLQISSINLHSLDFLMNSNLSNLKILQAQQNALSVISEDIIRSVPSLLELNLKQNSFSCDCDNSWFVQWIKNNNQTQVKGAYSYRCNYPPECKDSRLLDLNVQSCLVDISFICFISSTCVNVVILVASFTFHFSRFHLTYAYYLFLAWLYDSRNHQKRAACGYDAFVSYNAHDEAWVDRELVPQLEQEQGWRLCLHHRDFIPGTSILENIVDAIYGSRKTICVISHRYLQSEWCSKEMQLASFRLFDEREDVLILLFLEDIPSSHLSPYYRMKRLLKRRSYLSWPRAAQHPQLFWEKLRQALRSTNTEEEDRLRLTVTH